MWKQLFFSWSILVLLMTPSLVFAQAQGANPFELKQRIKVQKLKTDTIKKGPVNPFDINRKGAIRRDEHTIDFNDPSLFKNGWKVGSSIFWVFILLLFFLAALMPFARSTIGSFYKGVTGAGPFSILFRNTSTFFTPLGISMYIFYFLNMGLFVYLFAQHFDWIKGESLKEYVFISAVVVGISFLKYIAIRSIGGIFPVQKDAIKYTFLIGVFSSLIGLALFPANLILAYGTEVFRTPTIYITLFLLGILYLYRYFLGTFSVSPQIIRNKFNFFMYLCTLEIAPALVLVKFLLAFQGLEILN